MKYWRGYLTAAVFGFFTWLLIDFAKSHTKLIDMVYPYISRMNQSVLAEWSSGVTFCLWQLIAIVLILGLLASIVLMIVLRWNPFQWFGWVLSICSILFFAHTAIYGMNNYAGSIADDIRMEQADYSLDELEDAAIYYRDQANALAAQITRDTNGDAVYPAFQVLAEQAGAGFEALVSERSFSIFAGSTLPVKELGWADMYTSMGITGFTLSLTGEAAVNPQVPVVSMPFTMCHEMAHRMSIATEDDTNMAAFLACQANPSIEFQYSGYYMAYRYCYNALAAAGTAEAKAAAQRVASGVSDQLYNDLSDYNAFFAAKKDEKATEFATTVNDTYITVNGDERGTAAYGAVCDLLVSWYIQEIVLPSQMEEESKFDPFDERQVDLSGLANARPAYAENVDSSQ